MHTTHHHKPLRNPGTHRGGIAILCAFMACGLMTFTLGAQASPKKHATEKADSASAKKKGSVKVKHQRSSSEESTAERDRRLYRECKGLPNAGACLGYTRR